MVVVVICHTNRKDIIVDFATGEDIVFNSQHHESKGFYRRVTAERAV